MDIYGLIRNIIFYVVYPIVIVFLGLEFHKYIFWKYMIKKEEADDGEYEFHEPSIEMCSRCKNPDCSHRIADYVED